MVGRHKPHHDVPYDKTTTQMIWTLQNHRRNIQSGLSIGTTAPVEGSQRVPCFPPITLSRNDNTRTKLPRTTPRCYQRGEGVGSEGNHGITALRTLEKAAILNPMGRIFRSTRLLKTGGRDTCTGSHTELRET